MGANRERAHEATRQIQRYGAYMPSTETMEVIIERAIDAACDEAVAAEREANAKIVELLAEGQWRVRGDEEEVFACEHAAMILEDACKAIRARSTVHK